jgi:hypothetical protein
MSKEKGQTIQWPKKKLLIHIVTMYVGYRWCFKQVTRGIKS